MTIKRGGLGRNLSALLGNPANAPLATTYKTSSEPNKLAINVLQPGKYQPRRAIDDSLLVELAASIKQQGLLQPILVREISTPGKYEILAGERRWRASQLAELTEIPVIIKHVDDRTAMAIALVENLQREDLNVMDQVLAMQRLITEFDLTHQQIADLLHKSRTAISNFLRLMNLNDSVKRLLENSEIDMGHARALLMLDERQQYEVAQLVIAKELSVRDTEKLVNRIKKGHNTEKAVAISVQTIYNDQIDALAARLHTKIALKQSKSGKGTLMIHYENSERLESVLRVLQGTGFS